MHYPIGYSRYGGLPPPRPLLFCLFRDFFVLLYSLLFSLAFLFSGDVSVASRTLNAFFLIWRDWGFLPEQLDHARWKLEDRVFGRVSPLDPRSEPCHLSLIHI